MVLQDDDESYSDAYDRWWNENGFPDLAKGWVEVTEYHFSLYWFPTFMFGMFMWQGWFQKWFAFYVEHIISNFNWMVYFGSANALLASAVT